jgi:ribonuclease P protein component
MPPENANNEHLTFSKRERLCSEIQIAGLLHNRQKIFCHPLKCHYIFLPLTEEEPVCQIVISVPKRFFKHAVDRNRIKRLIREAYRLHHRTLLDPVLQERGQRAQLLITYVSKEISPYKIVEDKIIEILHRLTIANPTEGL